MVGGEARWRPGGGEAVERVSYRSVAGGKWELFLILMGESLTCFKDDGKYPFERKKLSTQEKQKERIINSKLPSNTG